MSRRTPAYRHSHGLLMPADFPVGSMASALTYEPSPDDVFVTTYPKCGTTWMQNILWLLAHGGQPLAAGKTLDEVFPHIELSGGPYVAAMPRPRLIKTHLPLAMTPWSDEAKYVYVARNPFDCAVSFFHHTRGFAQHYDFVDGTFDDYFECFVDGQVDFGDYFEHLLTWHERSASPNVLFLTYEGMKADTPAAIREVGRFLGDQFAAAAADPDVLAAVLEHSSLRRMKEDQSRWASERHRDAPAFIRKGVVGDWTSLFTPDQAQRLLERCDRAFEGTALGDLWPDIIEKARALARS